MLNPLLLHIVTMGSSIVLSTFTPQWREHGRPPSPPFEGMWASSARSEIHISINPPRGLSTLGNHIHPLLGEHGRPYSTSNGGKVFNLQRREMGPRKKGAQIMTPPGGHVSICSKCQLTTFTLVRRGSGGPHSPSIGGNMGHFHRK